MAELDNKLYKDLIEEFQKCREEIEKQATVCPTRGRCPTCGRRYNDGWYRDYPPYREPATPYWIEHEVWC